MALCHGAIVRTERATACTGPGSSWSCLRFTSPHLQPRALGPATPPEFPWTRWQRRIQATPAFKETLRAREARALGAEKCFPNSIVLTSTCTPGTGDGGPLWSTAGHGNVHTSDPVSLYLDGGHKRIQAGAKSCMPGDVCGRSNYNTPNRGPRPSI